MKLFVELNNSITLALRNVTCVHIRYMQMVYIYGGRAGNYVSILNIVTIRNYGLPLEMSGVRDVEYTELYIPVYW